MYLVTLDSLKEFMSTRCKIHPNEKLLPMFVEPKRDRGGWSYIKNGTSCNLGVFCPGCDSVIKRIWTNDPKVTSVRCSLWIQLGHGLSNFNLLMDLLGMNRFHMGTNDKIQKSLHNIIGKNLFIDLIHVYGLYF